MKIVRKISAVRKPKWIGELINILLNAFTSFGPDLSEIDLMSILIILNQVKMLKFGDKVPKDKRYF